jgi:hypothetical protein
VIQRDACEKVIEAIVAVLGLGDARSVALTTERSSDSMEPFIGTDPRIAWRAIEEAVRGRDQSAGQNSFNTC